MNKITIKLEKKDRKFDIYDELVKYEPSLCWVKGKKAAMGSALSFEIKNDNLTLMSNYFNESSLRSFVSEFI